MIKNTVSGEWRRDFTNNIDGWFFTRNGTSQMTTSFETPNNIVMKNSSVYCQIHLHDTDYSARNVNPVTIPQVTLELNEDFNFKIVYLKVKKVKMMNNCDPSPTHSVTNCLRKHAEKVICSKITLFQSKL